MNGRVRRITFHVFGPKVVEDLLDRGAVDEWREADAVAKAENRRKAAYTAKLTRSLKKGKTVKAEAVERSEDGSRTELVDWEEFGRDGLLR